jgi:hypothetical protein
MAKKEAKKEVKKAICIQKVLNKHLKESEE